MTQWSFCISLAPHLPYALDIAGFGYARICILFTAILYYLLNLWGYSWVDYTCICSLLMSVEFDASYTHVCCLLLNHTSLSWMVSLICPLPWLLEQFLPLYATVMILYTVIIPYMQLPWCFIWFLSLICLLIWSFACHHAFVLLLSWIHTWYAHWFDSYMPSHLCFATVVGLYIVHPLIWSFTRHFAFCLAIIMGPYIALPLYACCFYHVPFVINVLYCLP